MASASVSLLPPGRSPISPDLFICHSHSRLLLTVSPSRQQFRNAPCGSTGASLSGGPTNINFQQPMKCRPPAGLRWVSFFFSSFLRPSFQSALPSFRPRAPQLAVGGPLLFPTRHFVFFLFKLQYRVSPFVSGRQNWAAMFNDYYVSGVSGDHAFDDLPLVGKVETLHGRGYLF